MTLNRGMATRGARNYRTLASLSRINLLYELQQHGSKTITELAEATGLHHNTAREHLHRLIDAGFVASEPIPTDCKGRPKLRYRAAVGRTQGTPPVDAKARRPSQPGAPRSKHTPVRTGSVADEQLDTLGDHMNECGFDAVVETDRRHMVMHDCPFTDLAREHPQVCAVHFELVKDALRRSDGPIHARALHPFSTREDCVLDLDPGADHEAVAPEV
jgi:predicted ArsR family transcriptional regulator